MNPAIFTRKMGDGPVGTFHYTLLACDGALFGPPYPPEAATQATAARKRSWAPTTPSFSRMRLA